MAVVDDAELLKGIEKDNEKRERRLKTTRLGRKILKEEKEMENDLKFYKGPDFKVEDYENALKDTPYRDGQVSGKERRMVQDSLMGDFEIEKKNDAQEEIENLKKELGLSKIKLIAINKM